MPLPGRPPEQARFDSTKALRIATFLLALAGALASLSTAAGKAVFSVHDLQTIVSILGSKIDGITTRLDASDRAESENRDYTDRRIGWLADRVSALEQRQSVTPPPMLMPSSHPRR